MSWMAKKGLELCKTERKLVGANIYGKTSQTFMNKECLVLCTREKSKSDHKYH